MANSTEISWILRARDGVTTVLQKVRSGFASMAKAGLNAARLAFQAFAAIGTGAFALGAKFVQAYQVQAQAEAKLTAVLRATGYAAGFTTEELKKNAAQLQQQTGIGDEVILSTQGILASFRQIKGDTFLRATSAILDMSTVMAKAGQDSANIEQASIQVGKALNDPIAGLSALSRVGVTFSEQQKEQIRALQESGDLLGAQAVLLAELESEFGGAAVGIDSNVLAWTVFKAAVSDAQEAAGQALTENLSLTDGLNTLTDAIRKLMDSGDIDLWMENVASAFNFLLGTIRPILGAIDWVNSKMKSAGAFAGTLLGGGSVAEAMSASTTVPEEMAVEREQRLAEIRQRRADRAATAQAQQQAEMQVANARAAAEAQQAALWGPIGPTAAVAVAKKSVRASAQAATAASVQPSVTAWTAGATSNIDDLLAVSRKQLTTLGEIKERVGQPALAQT